MKRKRKYNLDYSDPSIYGMELYVLVVVFISRKSVIGIFQDFYDLMVSGNYLKKLLHQLL